MSRSVKSPCTQDCPDRHFEYCRVCVKLKEYKKNKNKEYELKQKENNNDYINYVNSRHERIEKATKRKYKK